MRTRVLSKILRLLFVVTISPSWAFSNDGTYTGSGNHLVPVKETDISLQKEILTIRKRINTAGVSVYYELFNPGEERDVQVGFEADNTNFPANVYPINGGHPYINNFTVNVNGKIVKHTISYLLNGESIPDNKRAITLPKLKQYIDKNSESATYVFVYAFKVRFKNGLNIIRHDYDYEMSSSIGTSYSFDYKLTPANRWANGQIDDFTLVLDLGDYEGINLNLLNDTYKDYFTFTGSGHFGREKPKCEKEMNENVFIKNGQLIFHHKNFHPEEELGFSSSSIMYDYDSDNEKRTLTYLPYSLSAQESYIDEQLPPLEQKVLQNIQLARDGYIFPDKDLYNYFINKTNWYVPIPEYDPDK
jgi:hypothetical protein